MIHLTHIALHPERYPVRDAYPFSLPVLQETAGLELPAPVTIFVGENGTGKSTLLEAIARRCGIHIWRGEAAPRIVRNRYEEELFRYLEVTWADGRVPGSLFSSRLFQDFAQMLEECARSDPGQLRYFGGKSLVTQSHGQSLMSYFAGRYQIRGLYLLDEPETALSPRSQLALLQIVQEMAAAGHAQFIISTHSPILLSCPGATLYSFDACPLRPVAYKETEHYRVYREFFGG